MLRFGAPLLARLLVIVTTMAALGASRAGADALLLIEADSGRVLHAENATYPWYPASISKIMTAYVTLRAVKEGRLRLDTLLTVSENALAQQPSKMGFPVGTQITVDDALKMLMVKSANDVAVVLAEGVSGSVEKFADEMNQAGARIGMTQSSWVNPNGLPAENQITSARDMAILARAVIREFPEHELYWRIPAIKFGRRVLRNYNKLIDRYPGADGMKTGFICASGFNLVATASRNGRRLIAVVLGAPSATERAEKTARLLERGFGAGIGLSWLMPSLASVDALQPIAAAPPNLRDEVCGKNRRRVRTDHGEEEENQPAGAQPELRLGRLRHDAPELAHRQRQRVATDRAPALDAADQGLGDPAQGCFRRRARGAGARETETRCAQERGHRRGRARELDTGAERGHSVHPEGGRACGEAQACRQAEVAGGERHRCRVRTESRQAEACYGERHRCRVRTESRQTEACRGEQHHHHRAGAETCRGQAQARSGGREEAGRDRHRQTGRQAKSLIASGATK